MSGTTLAVYRFGATIRRAHRRYPPWTRRRTTGPAGLPGLTALTLVHLTGAWAILTGVLEIAAAIRLRKEIDNEWWLGLSGALSIVFGELPMVAPGAGALALVLWIGACALVLGVFLVALGVRLRGRRAEAR